MKLKLFAVELINVRIKFYFLIVNKSYSKML